MISEELRNAIIENDIQKVHFIVFKENPVNLPDEYFAEALEVSNRHQDAIISDYIQLSILYKLLNETIKTRKIEGFDKIIPLSSRDIGMMLHETEKQLYKFYHSKPGKLITINSSIALNNQFSIYATRNLLGEYQIVVHKNIPDSKEYVYYQIIKDRIAPWIPDVSLYENPPVFYEKEADSFISRIKTAYIKITQPSFDLPFNLRESITIKLLLDLYTYILNTPTLFENLIKGRNFRIDKAHSGLQRTFNVILNQSDEYMLMLETKRKNHDNSKDNSKLIGAGAYGTVKPSWRVDSDIFEEWANKTTKGEGFIEAEYESTFSQDIISDYTKKQCELFNITLSGELFYKQTPKRSVYSMRAIDDLANAQEKNILSPKNTLEIFGDILNAIYLLHQKGKVHQDIKPKNILLYKAERYYAKLADFGISDNTLRPVYHNALSSIDFASPEILIANQSGKSLYYSFFHSNQNKHNSFTYNTYLNTLEYWANDNDPTVMHYKLPNPSNDIWALGILLFSLLYNRYPERHDQDRALIENDSLLRGLLQAERQKRISIKQALEIYPLWLENKLNPDSQPITKYYDSKKAKGSPSQHEWTIMTASGPIPLSHYISKHGAPQKGSGLQ